MKRTTRHRLEAALVGVLGAIVRPLPRRVLFVVGALIGRVWAVLDARHLRIAADNIRKAFPEWDEARVLRTARGVYVHFARTFLDILWMERRSVEAMLSLADEEGREHLDAVDASGRGAVFPTAHFGNWELQGVAVKASWRPVGVIVRPLDNPWLDRRLEAFRSKGGNPTLTKRRALADTLRLIRSGDGVAVLIDQNVQAKDGIFVDFFGRSACTTTVAAAIAVKTGCMVVPVHCPRMDDGRYRMIYGPPLEWQSTGNREQDIRDLTQRLTSVIEGWVRQYPDQWLWLHRRWKTQPAPAVEATP